MKSWQVCRDFIQNLKVKYYSLGAMKSSLALLPCARYKMMAFAK